MALHMYVWLCAHVLRPYLTTLDQTMRNASHGTAPGGINLIQCN